MEMVERNQGHGRYGDRSVSQDRISIRPLKVRDSSKGDVNDGKNTLSDTA